MTTKMTTEQVLKDLGRANINNIKHNKHINTIKHINTFNDCGNGNHEVPDFVPLASPPEASSSPTQKPLGEALASSGSPPWRFLKIDLFDNATAKNLAQNKRKLNVKFSFLLKNKPEYQYLAGALNTNWRFVKRGFDFDLQDDIDHYNRLEDVYRAMCQLGYDRVRATKLYQPSIKGKGATVYGMSVVIGQDLTRDRWQVAFIDGYEIYEFELSPLGLTDLQRQHNCIATHSQGEMARPRMSRRQFFGD